MSKKRLGAAPGEQVRPDAGKKLGRFGRLRAQPGFRMASIAFVLTVVLGIGSTAAYAYWSQRTDIAINGTTGYSLPTPTAARCVTASPNRVEWTPVTNADPEARYVLTFEARGRSAHIAVPLSYSSIKPADLSSIRDELGSTLASWAEMTVTVRTAIVKPAVNAPVQIRADQIGLKSELSPPLDMYYYTTLWANYPCR